MHSKIYKKSKKLKKLKILNQKKLFIVGAQRSGSTLLYKILSSHSQICMAKPYFPEPKYFLKNYKVNKNYFKKFFKHYKNENYIGEKSTSYLEYIFVAKRINKNFPDAKIFIILRNPADRAISNFFFSKKNNLEKRDIISVFLRKSDSIKKYKSSVNPTNYLGRGNYINYIKKYYNVFPKNRIKIIIFENLIKQKRKTLNDITEFLNIKKFNEKKISLKKKINRSNYNQKDIIKKIRNYLIKKYKYKNIELGRFLKIDLNIWDK